MPWGCVSDTWTTATESTNSITCNHSAWSSWNSIRWVKVRLTNSDTWTVWCENDYLYDVPTVNQPIPVVEPEPARVFARERAEQLLREHLSAEQIRELDQHKYFTVYGGRTKRRYRVYANRGHHGNIYEVDHQKGNALRSFCVAPEGDMPHHDRLLGQKLFIELAEDEFLAKANVTELQRIVA